MQSSLVTTLALYPIYSCSSLSALTYGWVHSWYNDIELLPFIVRIFRHSDKIVPSTFFRQHLLVSHRRVSHNNSRDLPPKDSQPRK